MLTGLYILGTRSDVFGIANRVPDPDDLSAEFEYLPEAPLLW